MSSLRLIPLDDAVVFPGMSITLTVAVGDDEKVALVPRHESAFAEVGVVAAVAERVRLPGGGHAVTVDAQHRALIGAAHTGPDGELYVEVDEHEDAVPNDGRTRTLTREYRAVVEEILELRGADGRIQSWLRAISEPGALADSCGYSPDLNYEQRLELLRTLDVTERLALAVSFQRERLAELQIRKRIRDDVQEGAEKQQRDYLLRKQMDSIRKELGEDDASVVEEYRTKIEDAGMPEAAHEQAVKELARLERMGEQSGEASMIRTYLDWLIALPWSKRSEERLDPVAAREVLDADHAGLEDVKDRVTEYLAVLAQLAHREVLGYAVLDVLEAGMVAVEHRAGRDRVEVLFRSLVPGDRDQPVEIGADHAGLARLIAHPLESPELLDGLLVRLLRHLGGLDLRAVLLDDRSLVLAELLADRVHLLAQQVVALLFVGALLDVVADPLADLQLLEALALQLQRQLEAFGDVHRAQQL